MSLIVAVNGAYHSYFDPKHMGNLQNNAAKSIGASNQISSHKKTPGQEYDQSQNKNNPRDGKRERKNLFARDLMSKNVYTISPLESIKSGLMKMGKLGIHHLLVMDQETLVGIVSDRDLLASLISEYDAIETVMTKKVLLCEEQTEMRLIAKAMLDEGISSVPVVSDQNSLLGIITKSDLLNCIVENMPIDIWI